jgi:hypothetical protein
LSPVSPIKVPIYKGNRGKTHGDKKESIPAPKTVK